MSAVSAEAQLRYILQWFGEFSELQREDFLPVLAAASAGREDILASQLAALSCDDKPVSLFQCRIKLFNEWYPTWSDDERSRLVKGVSDMDPEFGKKLEEQVTNGAPINGIMNDMYNHDEEQQENQSGNQPEVLENVVQENNEEALELVPEITIPLEITAAS